MGSSHQRGQTTPTTVIGGQIYDAADASFYDPKLYECESRYQSVDRFEDIDDAAIEHYRQPGYLVVRQAFSPDQIRDAKCALTKIIDQQGVGSVSIQFESWAAGQLDKMDRRQKALAVRKFMNFADTDGRLTTIARHERLLQLLSRLMNGKVPADRTSRPRLKRGIISTGEEILVRTAEIMRLPRSTCTHRIVRHSVPHQECRQVTDQNPANP